MTYKYKIGEIVIFEYNEETRFPCEIIKQDTVKDNPCYLVKAIISEMFPCSMYFAFEDELRVRTITIGDFVVYHPKILVRVIGLNESNDFVLIEDFQGHLSQVKRSELTHENISFS